MNINLTDEELQILDKLVVDGRARDRETALRFLIYYYDIKKQDIKSNEVS